MTYGTGRSVGTETGSLRAPMTCSTCTPLRASSFAAPDTARLIERAPCEPPATNSTGRSGRSPKWARAASRRAARSSPAMPRRSGTPTTRASRSASAWAGWCGKPTATFLVNFIPSRFATPGGTFTSWMTIGSSRRHAAR